jgi:hypothetical protein
MRKEKKRSLSEKNDQNALWLYRNSHNTKCRVVAASKEPQRVQAFEKKP